MTENEKAICGDCKGEGERILNPAWPLGDLPYSEKCSTCGGSGLQEDALRLRLAEVGVAGEELKEALDLVSWYQTCLEDVRRGVSVRGLAEAAAGYDSALGKVAALLSRARGCEPGAGEVAYLGSLAAQEAAYWEARRQGMGLNDKQIGDLLRVAFAAANAGVPA